MSADAVEGVGFDLFRDPVGVILDHVENLEPGLFVASVLASLDPGKLDARDAVRFLGVHERVASWWASVQTPVLVAAAGADLVVSEFQVGAQSVRIADPVREEIASALRWSAVTTQGRIDQARLLAGPLADTQAALARGEITTGHARIVTDTAHRVSSWLTVEQATHAYGKSGSPEDRFALARARAVFTSDCHALQARLLPVARCQGLSRTRTGANRAIDVIDAAGQARRRDAARRTRDVYLSAPEDGITTLIARLDTLTATTIMRAINTAATDSRIPGTCEANAGERRTEALTALILGTPPSSGDPTSRSPINVTITVDVTVPIREFDTTTYNPTTNNLTRPSPDLSPEILRLLTDPAVRVFARPLAINDQGHVLDRGRRRYPITGALRELIIARDGHCRFPGCNRAATRCQIDHATAWDAGGPSDLANLGALCTRHHQLKTHGGWTITTSQRDGTCTWTSPHGHQYLHTPQPPHEPPPRL